MPIHVSVRLNLLKRIKIFRIDRLLFIFRPNANAPVGPVGPIAPSAPAGPVGPVGPVAPVAPVAPVGPVGPVAPVAPVAPVGPVGPVAPVAPVEASIYAQLLKSLSSYWHPIIPKVGRRALLTDR